MFTMIVHVISKLAAKFRALSMPLPQAVSPGRPALASAPESACYVQLRMMRGSPPRSGATAAAGLALQTGEFPSSSRYTLSPALQVFASHPRTHPRTLFDTLTLASRIFEGQLISITGLNLLFSTKTLHVFPTLEAYGCFMSALQAMRYHS